jgi:hypothetical protein
MFGGTSRISRNRFEAFYYVDSFFVIRNSLGEEFAFL